MSEVAKFLPRLEEIRFITEAPYIRAAANARAVGDEKRAFILEFAARTAGDKHVREEEFNRLGLGASTIEPRFDTDSIEWAVFRACKEATNPPWRYSSPFGTNIFHGLNDSRHGLSYRPKEEDLTRSKIGKILELLGAHNERREVQDTTGPALPDVTLWDTNIGVVITKTGATLMDRDPRNPRFIELWAKAVQGEPQLFDPQGLE